MKMCLHLGGHKTGTTWIQQTFMKRLGVLRRNQCAYVGGGTSRKEISLGLMWPGRVFPSLKARTDQEISELFRQYVHNKAHGCDKIIISDETILGKQGILA